jgi:cytochrome c biogenesis protein CcdA
MELEELQSAWSQMSTELEQQKKLTNDIIMKMTQEKYRNKFKTVTTYETMGAFVCFCIAILFLAKFGELNTWYLQVCGVLSVSYLIILPIMVLSALKKIKALDISKGSYKDNLISYIKAKNRLLRLQRIGVGVGLLGMFFILPVCSKIISNKNIFELGLKTEQVVLLSITVIITAIFCIWAYKGYLKLTRSAQELLKDLE